MLYGGVASTLPMKSCPEASQYALFQVYPDIPRLVSNLELVHKRQYSLVHATSTEISLRR